MTQPDIPFLIEQAWRATAPSWTRNCRAPRMADHWPRTAALAIEWALSGIPAEEILAEVQTRYDEERSKTAAWLAQQQQPKPKIPPQKSSADIERAARTAALLAALSSNRSSQIPKK